MMMRVLLCLCTLLVLTSQGHGAELDENGIPRCQLSEADRHKLHSLLVKEEDGEAVISGPFVELWTSQFSQKSVPYCIKATTTRTPDEGKLIQTVFVENVNSKDYKETTTHLTKVKKNVYLISKVDGTPLSRLYIVYNSEKVIAYFQCSIEAVHPMAHVFHNFIYWTAHRNDKDLSLPDEIPLAKMAVIAVREEALSLSALEPTVQTSLDEAWNLVKNNEDLFGKAVETEPCRVGKKLAAEIASPSP